MTLTNAQIAELLARRSEEVSDQYRARAYRRAARAAFKWPVEASDLLEDGLPLTELYGIGPRLAVTVGEWLESPPDDLDPPEQRAGFLTLTQVRETLDSADAEWHEIKGDLQMHSEGSDGRDPIAEMARAADARGYEYVAITDHTKGLPIAGGMEETQFAEQWVEIEAVNQALEKRGSELRVLKGAEVNLNTVGRPDMDADFLGGLDVAVGSFHSSLRTAEDQTERYLGAITGGLIDVIGHPRGRMYDRRAGLRADWDAVFSAAEEQGVALEIDSYPDRQDLQVELLERAAKTAVFISVGTDAHAAEQLWFIEYGIAAAIRAGIARERIINYLDRSALTAWVQARRD